MENKEKYDSYSLWGDPSHWTQRGAFLTYQMLMKEINAQNGDKYLVLEEDDYDIKLTDQGKVIFGGIHEEDYQENFKIREPKAYQTDEAPLFLDPNQRVSRTIFVNDDVENEDVLLVIGDSYIDGYIIDDLAESFAKTVMVWGGYTTEIKALVDYYHPTIVINENAERCDRTNAMIISAKNIQGE